jgi:F-type H+-transporting ATPase subunit c
MALEGNINDASKALALGLATGIGAIGPGIGVGYVFELRGQLTGLMWLGFALTEAIVFYALGMAFVAFSIA